MRLENCGVGEATQWDSWDWDSTLRRSALCHLPSIIAYLSLIYNFLICQTQIRRRLTSLDGGQSVSCGAGHSAAISNGKLFMWGYVV